MSKVILHIDMDAFYAAVEQHDNPQYRNRPVIIGSDPKKGKGRGVVSTCSYEARKFGIHSAMPISEAYKRCPHGVYLRSRIWRYHEISDIIMGIFSRYSPSVEPLSLDEAFIDCSNMERLMGTPETIARNIKKEVLAETGLTCSVGVSAVKSVAKVASDMNKPDGLTICPPGEEEDFLAPLPVSRLWGVGKKTQEILYSYGINTIGDISSKNKDALEHLFGKNGEHLWYLAHGIDDRSVLREAEARKSVSEEITFEEDCAQIELIYYHLKRLCDSLAFQLFTLHIGSRTVTVKLRYDNFKTITRSHSFESRISAFSAIHGCAVQLLQSMETSRKKIRLIGVSLSNLEGMDSEYQPDLFENVLAEKKGGGETIFQELKEKYGEKICRGSLLPKGNGKEKS